VTSLRDAVNRLFEDSVIQPREDLGVETWAGDGLALDIYETEDELVVKADLPGMRPEDVDVSVVGDVLTIKGETRDESEIKEENYVRRERRYGSFSRSVRLPTAVEAGEAEASYTDGMLILELPKAEEVKPKRIEVQAS
jgi:HSP20 family protein